MEFTEYADREMLAMMLANRLAGALKKCLLVHEFATFAVPGGSTPGPIFDMLSGTDLDWSRVHVMPTDERWVPEDDERSNAALISARLLTDKAAGARLLPFYVPDTSVEEGVAVASAALEGQLPISLLLLGMGADMHTASLFPGAAGLTQALAAGAPAVCAVQPEGQGVARASLAAHVLQGAMEKHLVIFGDDKRAALERARGLPPEQAPVAAVLDETHVHWTA